MDNLPVPPSGATLPAIQASMIRNQHIVLIGTNFTLAQLFEPSHDGGNSWNFSQKIDGLDPNSGDVALYRLNGVGQVELELYLSLLSLTLSSIKTMEEREILIYWGSSKFK